MPIDENSPSGGSETGPVNQSVDQHNLEEEFGTPPDINEETPQGEAPLKQPHHKRFIAWFQGLDRNRKILYGSLAALAVIVLGISAYALLHNPAPPKVASFPVYHAPTADTVPSLLTGLQVDPAVNKLQVTGVMIENSVFARPQSGLSQAGIVYEAIAEAGITRFLALFQDTKSEYLGPVRSARPYYVQWCQAFDCALAHVGGSPEALSDLKKWNVKNIDQYFGGQYFHRITSRYAPHNMYTSQAQLTKYEKAKGYTTSSYTGYEHLLKEPKLTAADITTTSINFDYPGSAYDVHYSYNKAKGTYDRSEGGEPHYSVDSGGHKTRNSPKVVIAMVMAYSHESDAYHSSYQSVGSGTVYVFQDGGLTKGTWTRSARDTNFVLKDSHGNPIKLAPGQTWISALASNADVSYK
jgi:hypothetical protein